MNTVRGSKHLPTPARDTSRRKGRAAVATSKVGEARIGPLLALPQVLEEAGVEPRRAFRRAGIKRRVFDHPENRISYEDLGRLLSACVKLGGRDDIGLLAGARFTLADFGALGELMRHSATVGDALRILILHLHFYDRAAVPVMLKLEYGTVFLGYSLQQAAMPGSGQLQNAAIAVAHQMLRELCGPAWRPAVVQFSHRRPNNIANYRRVFGRDIRFDAELSGFSFTDSWLKYPIVGADPGLYIQLNSAMLDAEAGGSMSVAEEVQCILHQLLPSGAVSAASVARLFGVSERTLRLRLQVEGTSMQQLLSSTRFELARHLLKNTQLPMTQIAAALCYADSAVFSRAFSSWAGVSPRQWRARSVG